MATAEHLREPGIAGVIFGHIHPPKHYASEHREGGGHASRHTERRR